MTLGPNWVKPYWLERQSDPPDRPANASFRNWTVVGAVSSRRRAIVDQRGLLTPPAARWSLDWWVGGDDRWHVPSREPTVRQHLVDDTPVIETLMRVPSGDAVQRVYAVAADGGVFAVMEVTNRSPAPFAVAFAVRPYEQEGISKIERVAIEGATVRVDGEPAVFFPKKPQRMATSTAREGDAAAAVFAGTAGTELPHDIRCDQGLATAAFLFPLAHGATIRVGVPLEETAGNAITFASSDSAVSGWKALTTSDGMRLDLPEGRLASAVEANRRYLLLFADARRELARERRPRFRLRRDRSRASVRLYKILELAEVERAGGDPRCLKRLEWMLEIASPTFTWPDVVDTESGRGTEGAGHSPTVAAAFVTFVCNLLAVGTTSSAEHEIALCSMLPHAWRGQQLEVHDLPTALGAVSFAVRWHGDRPALLWNVPSTGSRQIRVTAPGLDASWSTTEPQGEALLAAPPVAAR